MPLTVERDNFGIYFHGASESEHSRFTQVSFKALSKRTKSFMPRPPSDFFLIRVVFFILAGFCFQIKSNTILLTSVAKFFGVSITLEINSSLERANVLTIFILPYIDRSLWDRGNEGMLLEGYHPMLIFTSHRQANMKRYTQKHIGKNLREHVIPPRHVSLMHCKIPVPVLK